jgi:hypothetical protein
MIRLFDSEVPTDTPRLPDGASAAPRGELSNESAYRLDVMRSSRIHRLLALGFPLVGLILSALYVVSYGSIGSVPIGPVSIGPASIGRVKIGTVSMYTAQSLVYIQPPPHWPNNDDPAAYDSYIQHQILSMTRREVLAGALKILAPGVWQQSGESDDSAADRLRGAVEVARVGTGYLVAITAHANSPNTATALANAVAASYIENTALEQKASDAGGLTILKEEQERITKELDDDRAEQATLNAQLARMTGATTGAAPKLQRLSDLANDITRLQEVYDTVDEQLQNQTMEDSAPGTAHLAETAVPPSYFAISGVVRNALLLLFAFILLGFVAAVVAHKMDQRTAVQSPRIVLEATPAGSVREIPVAAETAAAAAVLTTPAAPPARQVTQESATPERAAPESAASERVVPVRPAGAPKPLPRPASVVAENWEAQSFSQRRPVAPAVPRNIELASLWLAGSASQSAPEPRTPMMRKPTTEDPRSQSAERVETPPAQQLRDENLKWLQEKPPWWLTDAPPPTDSSLTQPRKPLLGAWHSIPAHDGQKPAVAQVREREKAADEMPTRLSGLRSLHFSLGFKELSQKKDAGRGGSGNRSGAGNRARTDAALVDPEQTMAAEVLAPQPEHDPVKAKWEETIARAGTTRWMTAEPEFLSRSRGRDQ